MAEDRFWEEDPDFGIKTGGKSAAERRALMQPSDPDILAVVSIDVDDLDQELQDIAANMAYWGMELNKAKAAIRDSKVYRDDVRSSLEREHRADLEAEIPAGSKKRVTVKEVDAMVLTDDEYMDAQTVVAKTELQLNNLTVLMDAIRVKADALRSLCANVRAEREATAQAV